MFTSAVTYVLFGVCCSMLTYLVSVHTSLETKLEDDEKTEGKQNTPGEKESPFFVVQQPVVDVMPLDPELALSAQDLSLDEKSLSLSDDEDYEKKADLRKFGDGLDLNLPEEDVIDFETYKNNLDAPKMYTRCRSFSEPRGSMKRIPYSQSMEDAFNNKTLVIGELPMNISPVLAAVATGCEDIDEYVNQPGSPSDLNQFDLSQNEPGQAGHIEKVNERKPMVFVGGVSASTTSIELVTELKSQGFNVTVLPRIRYGVSFGFCPDLVLSSNEEVDRILAMGRVWVKDRWIDVRPYIPKDDEEKKAINSPPALTKTIVETDDIVHGSVAYISHEDLMNTSCTTSPSSSHEIMSPPLESMSPVTLGQFYPMPPGYQFQNIINFDPQLYQQSPIMSPMWFPATTQTPLATGGEFVSFQTPSHPPGFSPPREQHPLEA